MHIDQAFKPYLYMSWQHWKHLSTAFSTFLLNLHFLSPYIPHFIIFKMVSFFGLSVSLSSTINFLQARNFLSQSPFLIFLHDLVMKAILSSMKEAASSVSLQKRWRKLGRMLRRECSLSMKSGSLILCPGQAELQSLESALRQYFRYSGFSSMGFLSLVLIFLGMFEELYSSSFSNKVFLLGVCFLLLRRLNCRRVRLSEYLGRCSDDVIIAFFTINYIIICQATHPDIIVISPRYPVIPQPIKIHASEYD